MSKKIGLGLVILFSLFLASVPVMAAETRFSDSINLASEQTINDNILAVGGSVTLDGKATRDLIVLAGDATVSGEVSQDLTFIGGNIDISGTVAEDFRAAAGTVKISGKVKKDILILAGSVIVEQGAEVIGDLEVYGGAVSVAGLVGGELRGNTSTAIISGKINKNVSITTRDIKLAKTAELGGDFNYTSDEAATIQSGSIIAGKVYHSLPQNVAKRSSIASAVLSALAYILLAIVLVLVLPKSLKDAKEELAKNFWPSLLVGVLSLVVVPTLFLVLAVTIIGAPIGIILIVLYGIAVYVGKIVLGFLVGEKILSLIEKKKEVSAVWSIVFGLVVLLIIFKIPFVGGIFNFIATLFGLGGLVLWIKKVYFESRKAKAI